MSTSRYGDGSQPSVDEANRMDCASMEVTKGLSEPCKPLQRTRNRRRRRLRVLVVITALTTLLLAAACYVNTLPSRRNELHLQRKYHELHRRLEGGGDDDNMNDDLANGSNDDAAEDENDGKDGDQNRHQNDDAPIYVDDDFVDDFYAFQEDEGPRRLLPVTATDVFGFVLASMGATLAAAAGGIGGGGILVPVYIAVMQFHPREAIPLSAVTVLGGAMAGTLLVNARRRHPIADRPLIDWDLVMVMEPLVLVGALIGTFIHRVLSDKVLVVMLVVFLSVTARTMLLKAQRMHRAETKYIAELKTARTIEEESARRKTVQFEPVLHQIDETKSVETPLHSIETPKSPEAPHSIETPLPTRAAREKKNILITNPDFDTLRSDLLEQEKVAPREKILAMCGLIAVLVGLQVMIGGGDFKSPWGIPCGGVEFWLAQVVMAACLIASAWAGQTYLVNRHEIKELVNFDFVHGDIRWDQRGSWIYPLMFCSAGVLAGLFGIGGAMVTVPLLLSMGVHPAVATATSSCMTLFTTVFATTSFVIYGLLLTDYTVVCLLIGFFASLFGQQIMLYARKDRTGQNFERNSLIMYAVGSVILLAALLMTVLYVLMIVSFDDEEYSGGICVGYSRVST